MMSAVAAAPGTLAALAELVEARSGLRYAGSRRAELATRAAPILAEAGCASWEAFLARLCGGHGAPLLQRLLQALTVGETYFFRHRVQFEAIERHVLPEIFERRESENELRLWCAGCATGEEAYSLAIVVQRLGQQLQGRRVTILATDLNQRFLEHAEAALYGEWSFRETDDAFKAAYFTREGGRYRVRAELRRLVRFMPLNLVDDSYPSSANGTANADLIMCRNVLIYFAPERSQQVVERLGASLAPGGWLALGPSDTLPGLLTGFEACTRAEAMFYRRIPARGRGREVDAALLVSWPSSGAAGVESATGARATAPDQRETATAPGPLAVASEAPSTTLVPTASAARHQDGALISSPSVLAGPHDRPFDSPHAVQPSRPAARSTRPRTPWRGSAEGGGEVVPKSHSSAPERRHLAATPALSDRAGGVAWQDCLRTACASADQGHLDVAEEYCRRAIAQARLRPEPYHLLGLLRQAQGDDAGAFAAFRQALYVDRGFAPAHLALAAAHRRTGNVAQARQALARTRRLLESRAAAEVVLAEAGLTVGRLRDALALAEVLDDGQGVANQ